MSSPTQPDAGPPYQGGAVPAGGDGSGGSRGGALVPLLLLLVLALLAWALWATFVREDSSAGPDVGVTLSDITDDPQEYYGQRVVVSGQIDDVLEGDDRVDAADTGGSGFLLGDDAEVLVVGSNLPELAAINANEDIAEGDVVQVTGTVEAFDEAGVEDDLGIDLEDRLFQDFSDRPAIRASAISLVPVVPSQGEQRRITVEALEDEPEEFLGSQLTVREGEVEDVISPRVAALSDDVLLITPPNTPALSEGQAVEVNGRVVEVSTVQLVNALDLRNEDELFTELEVSEQDIEDYDIAVVAGSVTPRR